MLTVLEQAGLDKESRTLWRCLCDCGKEKIIVGKLLKNGSVVSCGCYGASRGAANQYKHGDASKGKHSKLYEVWTDIKKRCYNTKFKYYADYGGRGIVMCDEWKSDYANFKKWAMENGYDSSAPPKKCTLDRIDVNGNYCPENCRWVSMVVQCRNRRNNRMIEYNGETKCVTEVARETHVAPGSLWSCIFYKGMSVTEAIEHLPKHEPQKLKTE